MCKQIAAFLTERFGPAVGEHYTMLTLPELPRIVTHHDPKPIPDRRFDWSAITVNYDLGSPTGYGRTEQDAVIDLLEQIGVEADSGGEQA